MLKTVTITGADDSIDPMSLFRLSERYPFVEWGILLSKSSMGNPRFPSERWVGSLMGLKQYPGASAITLSGHICGSWVRNLCGGGIQVYWARKNVIMNFQRFQLNFHSDLHKVKSIDMFAIALKVVSYNGQQIVFQVDGVNDDLMEATKRKGVDAVPLFDVSAGTGVLPSWWKSPVGNYCGYAGGLSPDNLKVQLELISGIVDSTTIWIDAETHLRSDNDKQFDLKKVEEFLSIAEPWVIK